MLATALASGNYFCTNSKASRFRDSVHRPFRRAWPNTALGGPPQSVERSSTLLGSARRQQPCGGPSPAFDDCQELVHADVLHHIQAAADPADLDAVDAVPFSQPKMKSHPMVALIPPATVHFIELYEITSHDRDVSPNAIPVRPCAEKSDLQPMIPRLRIIPQDGGFPAN